MRCADSGTRGRWSPSMRSQLVLLVAAELVIAAAGPLAPGQQAALIPYAHGVLDASWVLDHALRLVHSKGSDALQRHIKRNYSEVSSQEGCS
jgi:hypothetical protein